MADCAPHDACDPDECFAAKMRYWRTNGGLSVHYAHGGRKQFHDTTITERRDQMVREAAEVGIKPEPAGARWV